MGLLKKTIDYFTNRLPFRLDLRKETPHRIAMGVAIGIFVAIVPSVGIGPFVSFLLALTLNGNKLIAIALTFLSNPITFVPISYPSFLIGSRLLNRPHLQFPWVTQTMASETPVDMIWRYIDFSKDVFLPIFAGALVLGFITGLVSYFITLYVVKFYRSRNLN
ncbi:MAG: DUF2062 domain-containing protein [bacterium]